MTQLKYILSAAAAAFVSQALATASQPNHTGFYLGINGGYEIEKNKMKHNINGENHYTASSTLTSQPFSLSNKSSLNSKGFTGGTFLGYQHQLRCFVVGLEASFSFFKSDKKKTLGYDSFKYNVATKALITENHKLKHKYNFGGSIKLGYLVTPTVVAGIKLGYARDVYNLKIDNVYKLTTVTVPGYTSSKNIKVNSFVPGVYVEKLINNHWLIGGEYNYSISKKKKLNADNYKFGNAASGTNYQGTKTFKPASHAVKIRLGYKF